VGVICAIHDRIIKPLADANEDHGGTKIINQTIAGQFDYSMTNHR
jgi:hypothetical protein